MGPETINWRAGQFWVTGVLGLMNLGLWLYAWRSNRDNARADALKEVETRVTKLEESSITHDELGKVYERINDVGSSVSEVKGTLGKIGGTVDMIMDHLLNSNGEKS